MIPILTEERTDPLFSFSESAYYFFQASWSQSMLTFVKE